MAKTSSVEKNKRRMKLAQRFAAKRARLRAIADDKKVDQEERSAQLVADAHPQSLRAHRAAALGLSQVQALAHRAARAGIDRPDPWHGQVELVREAARCR
jgi:hypothetical protein